MAGSHHLQLARCGKYCSSARRGDKSGVARLGCNRHIYRPRLTIQRCLSDHVLKPSPSGVGNAAAAWWWIARGKEAKREDPICLRPREQKAELRLDLKFTVKILLLCHAISTEPDEVKEIPLHLFPFVKSQGH
ncbi:hypothetical protein CapIbe_015747 [Capra ibex]